jgi:hypothetical protein
MINDKLWVIDVEQYPNFHSICAINVGTKKKLDFVLYYNPDSNETIDERLSYLKWLNWCSDNNNYWITFNGLNYDYPLIHNIFENKNFFVSAPLNKILDWLYRKSNDIIDNNKSKVYISESDSHILQYDLFKINHFDRHRCSLKWVEFSLKWKNLKDLPIPPGSIIKKSDIRNLVEYNYNDVEATLKFWHHCKKQIELREQITLNYGINARNMSNTAIGKNILIKYYIEHTGIDRETLRELYDKTYYTAPRDVISDKITFSSPELKKLLRELKKDNTNLLNTKFEKRIWYKNTRFDILKGGIHSHLPPLYIEEDDEYELVDFDFGSYYPMLMLLLKIHPPQLGKEILLILNQLTEERLEAKAKGDKSKSDSLKLSINSCYGLMGDKHSFMYSPTSMFKVTFNGQLILLMLIEKLYEVLGDDIWCFYANTDGATFKLKRTKRKEFDKVCKAFYDEFLPVKQEFVNYKKCYIRDVNNYHITKTNNDVKRKGFFELPQDQLVHKNNSQGIIAIAFDRYVVNNIPFSETINNHLKVKDGYDKYFDKEKNKWNYRIEATGIYDFLIGIRARSSPKRGKAHYEIIYSKNGNVTQEKIQKVNRYYVSTSGVKILKVYEDGTEAKEKADNVYNNLLNYVNNPKDSYDNLNTRWYIKECEKTLDSFYKKQKKIAKNQMSLF